MFITVTKYVPIKRYVVDTPDRYCPQEHFATNQTTSGSNVMAQTDLKIGNTLTCANKQ